MSCSLFRLLGISLVGSSLACGAATATSAAIPDPVIDAPLATTKGVQTAVIAGGCFWGIEAVFEHVKGVTGVTSGYSGGAADTANTRWLAGVTLDMLNRFESLMILHRSRMVSF